MTERELNIALREMARAAGLCEQWYKEWKDDDTIDRCLDRYIRGFDFAKNNDYPPLDFCRKNFMDGDLLRHNIYLDKKVKKEILHSGYYVFLGDSDGDVLVNGFVAVMIYCRHNSRINVHATGGARVFVTYYDDSSGDCSSDGYSKCKQYIRKRE